MRILQLVHNWDYYNQLFNMKFSPSELSWAQIQAAYIFDGFNMGHILAPELNDLGQDAAFIIINNNVTQRRWARLHGLVTEDPLEIAIEQIRSFDPDVLYVTDPYAIDRRIFRLLSRRPDRLVAWRAAPIPSDADFSHFDFCLTSDLKLAPLITQAGCKEVKFHLPGFRKLLPDVAIEDRNRVLVFSGSYGPVHVRRNALLLELAQQQLTGLVEFDLSFYLATGDQFRLPTGIFMHARPPVFGRDLLQIYATNLSTFHFPIDIAESNATAMRMFEATGSGCILFIHESAEMFGLFAENEIVRFSSISNLIQKHVALVSDPHACEAISSRLAQSCLRNHSTAIRAKEFLHLLR